jgi:hypothetical protein
MEAKKKKETCFLYSNNKKKPSSHRKHFVTLLFDLIVFTVSIISWMANFFEGIGKKRTLFPKFVQSSFFSAVLGCMPRLLFKSGPDPLHHGIYFLSLSKARERDFFPLLVLFFRVWLLLGGHALSNS